MNLVYVYVLQTVPLRKMHGSSFSYVNGFIFRMKDNLLNRLVKWFHFLEPMSSKYIVYDPVQL